MHRGLTGAVLVVAAGAAMVAGPVGPRNRSAGVDAGRAASRGAAQVTAAAVDVERLPDGLRLRVADGVLALHVKTDAIVRVTFSKAADFRADDMVVVGPGETGAGAALNPFRTEPARETPAAVPPFTIASASSTVTLSTARLRVSVDRRDGAVAFADAQGRTILAETPGGHRLTPATVQGEQTFHVQQLWRANEAESLYGLGQRQEGKLDLKGYDFDLWQRNTVVHIPMLVSSRGYGLLWDNTAPSKFGDIRPFEAIPADQLVDRSGRRGGLSAGVFPGDAADIQAASTTAVLTIDGAAAAERGAPPPIRGWQGQIVVPATGDYQFQTYSNGTTRLWLDGALRIDHYKQNWATEYDQFKVRLQAGRRYAIKVSNSGGTTLQLRWKTPPPTADTSMWSEVGEGIDYYFIYGPDIDAVVAGYRDLTGRASMLPDWAFGFWQSKNKYNTQDEVLRTLAEFRRRRIPLVIIVLDWQYWPPDRWGDHEFEASRYPDPDAMIRAIHDSHAHFMLSVWGKFYPVTQNYQALAAIDGLYLTTIREHTNDWLSHEYAFYDVFNAPARKLFWTQVNRALFSKGVDAWWMDATEPDVVQPSPATLEALRHDIDRTAIGTASRVMNAYPLMNSEAVYDGQRSSAPDQRVFILTRSGYAGIQRYGTVTWSGDITSTFQTLRKQITAGLDFSISGTPYWTTDTGGYAMDPRFANARAGEALDEWRELNARWFQYSTFCPLLRVHGADRPREMWNIGDETTPVYQAELKFDRLRYALFPYIYSTAGAVTQDGYTMMRPLVMDFRADATARAVTDQFMFGSALLVNPVTEYKARSRRLYLPAGTRWYDFWSGRAQAGGRTITAEAPYDALPLFVRAGSIVPIGPDQQYIGEQSREALTLYVYAGADGRFSLYEDDGRTYGYERGAFSRIPLAWNDASRTLTIGARAGSFDGMPAARTFTVVLVSPASPVGYAGASAPGRTVAYTGQTMTVEF
jgi:alpha-D-xyloside xylohydrolase